MSETTAGVLLGTRLSDADANVLRARLGQRHVLLARDNGVPVYAFSPGRHEGPWPEGWVYVYAINPRSWGVISGSDWYLGTNWKQGREYCLTVNGWVAQDYLDDDDPDELDEGLLAMVQYYREREPDAYLLAARQETRQLERDAKARVTAAENSARRAELTRRAWEVEPRAARELATEAAKTFPGTGEEFSRMWEQALSEPCSPDGAQEPRECSPAAASTLRP